MIGIYRFLDCDKQLVQNGEDVLFDDSYGRFFRDINLALGKGIDLSDHFEVVL